MKHIVDIYTQLILVFTLVHALHLKTKNSKQPTGFGAQLAAQLYKHFVRLSINAVN